MVTVNKQNTNNAGDPECSCLPLLCPWPSLGGLLFLFFLYSLFLYEPPALLLFCLLTVTIVTLSVISSSILVPDDSSFFLIFRIHSFIFLYCTLLFTVVVSALSNSSWSCLTRSGMKLKSFFK